MEEWIIGIGGSEVDGVVFRRFKGTEKEVKKKLFAIVKEDRCEDKENFDFGTESVKDIQKHDSFGHPGFYAYNCFSDYHIDYQAIRLADVQEVAL